MIEELKVVEAKTLSYTKDQLEDAIKGINQQNQWSKYDNTCLGFLEKHLNGANVTVLMALNQENSLVGYAIAVLEMESLPPHTTSLEYIATTVKCQGIGSKLLKALVTKIKDEGSCDLLVSFFEPVKPFYDKFIEREHLTIQEQASSAHQEGKKGHILMLKI